MIYTSFSACDARIGRTSTLKNPPEDGTVARATVVVERGPSELLNHMVPHFQGGLGAGEVDKMSMMIECDLVGVLFSPAR